MDAEQRAAEGRRIADARAERGWSQKELAEAAGVAPNTVGSIESGKKTQAGKLAAVRSALGLRPVAATQEYSQDVEVVRDMIGLWLMGMPSERRAEYAARIIRAIVEAPPAGAPTPRGD
jgi:transcriptional regulator with XRE-family HTH domain